MTPVHPIENESYRILAERGDLSIYGPLAAAVVARIIGGRMVTPRGYGA